MRGRRGAIHPPREERPALPAFDAVPRQKPRHDGWPPTRQVAFIDALADTGSVKSAAAQVNMSTESAYALRRAPGAEGRTRAWEAALDMGVLRESLSRACREDEAFERALHGELVPIVSAGKPLGVSGQPCPTAWLRIVRGTIRPATRRKRNDHLPMVLLRHYTQTGGQRAPSTRSAPPAKRGTDPRPPPAPPESPAPATRTGAPSTSPTAAPPSPPRSRR